MTELNHWDSFYVIIGSAAGALIGLQFVVMTLLAERPPVRAAEAAGAFATPTIVHFSTSLLLSALLQAPWHKHGSLTALVATIGVLGSAYTLNVARCMRSQRVYRPLPEGWALHAVLPLSSYAGLAAASVFFSTSLDDALFAVAGCVALLLFTGIHNAWDAVAYHVLVHMNRHEASAEP
jgi:hypothetical protein